MWRFKEKVILLKFEFNGKCDVVNTEDWKIRLIGIKDEKF